ncbi:MAG: single-stranded-DNA-specific exonuclease RecJ [Flavobacteriaceae bacterium]
MRWSQRDKPDSAWVDALHEAFNQDPTKPLDRKFSRLLVSRGIKTYADALTFFKPEIDQLHDPFLMKDMDRAVSRIKQGIAAGERILIFGDYDVDGTTAVALVYSYLEKQGVEVSYYIPDRYLEGYGISCQGIQFASDNDFSLIIALDCGVKSIEEVDFANSLGVDMVICDHHTPGDELPNAVAVLDPKRLDCPYPFKELCGCGVGFKLLQAIETSEGRGLEFLMPLTDLVAVAIGADVVSVMGENRVLANLGLEVITKNPRPGFKALLGQAKRDVVSLTDLNFSLAPRINAAGRMKQGVYAVSLMLTDNLSSAEQEAKAIEQFNIDRRSTDQSVSDEALQQIRDLGEEDRCSTVVYHPDWHKGVIGIVASRLISSYYRPTLVFTKSGEYLAASARSVQGYDIYSAIDACAEHLIQFGGHAYAAGLSLKESSYQDFKEAFEKQVTKTLKPEHKEPEVIYDYVIDPSFISQRNFRILNRFEPFGPDNPEPVFRLNKVQLEAVRLIGSEGKHLKARCHGFDLIGFGFGEAIEHTKNKVDLLVTIGENNWNGKRQLQLQLKDLKESRGN